VALDGIYLHHIKNELEAEILNARVEQTWSSGLYFVFQLYKEKQRYYLTFNLNASFTSVYLSKKPVDKVDNSNFLASLKKHLTGGILKEITQFSSDRVLLLKFTVYDFILGPIEKTLIFEAMGRHANLILLENDKILDLYKKMFVLDGRHLVPNATYEYFKTDKLDAKDYEFNALLSPKEITEKYLGISLRLAKYLSEHNVSPYDIKIQPTLSLKENKSYFFNIFEGETKSFDTLSEALENRIMESKDDKLPYLTFIKNQIKKLDKKHDQLQKQMHDAEIHLSDKDKGDYIYANAFDLNEKRPHIGSIELDSQKSLSANAQSFYKNYQKAKRALSFIETELKNVFDQKEIYLNFQAELELATKHELNDFKELLIPYGYLKQSSKNNTRQTKHKIEILTIKDSIATFIIGKNSLQNGKIINDLGNKDDYWFHVKDAPGSHVLVKTETLTEQVIRKAAMLAAYFSTLKESSSIPVNYTLFRNVSKMSGKPASLVKIKNEKTIFIDIDKDLIESILKSA